MFFLMDFIFQDGGKLELWDALTGYNHHSLHSGDEEIKCIKVSMLHLK